MDMPIIFARAELRGPKARLLLVAGHGHAVRQFGHPDLAHLPDIAQRHSRHASSHGALLWLTLRTPMQLCTLPFAGTAERERCPNYSSTVSSSLTGTTSTFFCNL